VAAGAGRTDRLHGRWFRAQQRVFVAALLTLFAVAPLRAQSDINFDPDITQEDFRHFSEIVSQAIFATPVEPARATGLLGFDIGVAATAIEIDEDAQYWINSVESNDLVRSGYLLVPRVVASKGLSVVTVSASYAQIPSTDVKIIGAAVDIPILKGTTVTPGVAVRGTYSQLSGVDEYELRNFGAEVFISKGFGPITPYAAAGYVRTDAEGHIEDVDGSELLHLEDEFQNERITVGVRLSLLVPRIVIEATQGEELTYAAKISLGL
jgi:hypothetical protein